MGDSSLAVTRIMWMPRMESRDHALSALVGRCILAGYMYEVARLQIAKSLKKSQSHVQKVD